jgi:DNA end-binding protein Ku
MARPYWSGQLKISLVSFGIHLFPATSSTSEITFHQIDRRTGLRVHHQNVVDGDKPVDNSEIVKGYEYSKGKYLVIEPDEINNLRIESRKTLELSQFVSLPDIPPALFEKPYFVTPQSEDQDEAFAVIREALGQTKKAGIGELAFGGREHLIAIAAPPEKESRHLIAYTLRYGEELRKAAGYLPEIAKVAIGTWQLGMATELIQQYSAPLTLSRFKDDYEAALRKLIDAKQKNEPLLVENEKPQRAKVVNLMDALRKSVEQTKRSAGAQKTPSGKAKAEKKGPQLVKPARRAHSAA